MEQKDANKNKSYWDFVKEIANEVDNWPEWKKSGISALRFGRSFESRILSEDKDTSYLNHEEARSDK